jgi:predicted DNA-binding transcriptional regulator AlpA
MGGETSAKSSIEPAGPPALLTQQMVRRFYLPLAERTFWRWVSEGKFPRPDLALGGKSRFWKRETVEGWISAQVAGGAK